MQSLLKLGIIIQVLFLGYIREIVFPVNSRSNKHSEYKQFFSWTVSLPKSKTTL